MPGTPGFDRHCPSIRLHANTRIPIFAAGKFTRMRAAGIYRQPIDGDKPRRISRAAIFNDLALKILRELDVSISRRQLPPYSTHPLLHFERWQDDYRGYASIYFIGIGGAYEVLLTAAMIVHAEGRRWSRDFTAER